MTLPNIKLNKESFLQGDSVVWMILLALCMISIVEVYSASSRMTYGASVHFWRPVVEHASFIIVGLFITWVVHKMPCTSFKFLSVLGLMLSFILLTAVLFMGRVNGAARWLHIAGITIQPSEFAKLTLVGTVAMLLATFRDKKTGGASMLAFKWVAGLTAIVCLLIVGENFSTAGIIFIVMLLMTWFAQGPKRWLLLIVVGILLAGTTGYLTLKLVPQQTAEQISELPMLHRFSTWSKRIKKGSELPPDPKDYNIHDNVQVTHARIAVATCNIVGKGPGQSVQRDFLPHAVSDFIYAIIIEEYGLVGGLIVLMLYIILFTRVLRICIKRPLSFGALMAFGLGFLVIVQAMVNMGVSIGLLPVTGQPLPFVSMGGSSIMATGLIIGMILSVTRSIEDETALAPVEGKTENENIEEEISEADESESENSD